MLAVTIVALALILGWFALDPARPGCGSRVGLLAGGALGNLADRVRDGAVTDFIDPPLWPAFNLADVAITLGRRWCIALAALAPGAAAEGVAGMSPEPRLVHADERLAVIDKPAGLVVHAAPGHRGADARRRARRPARRRRGPQRPGSSTGSTRTPPG